MRCELWVLVVDCRFRNLFEVGKPVTSEIGVRNSGLLPALDVEINHNVGIGELPAGEIVLREPARKSRGTIAPGSDLGADVVHSRPRTAQDMENFRNGPHGAFAWGRITYTDPSGTPGQTDFCFFADKKTGEASLCDRWNSAK